LWLCISFGTVIAKGVSATVSSDIVCGQEKVLIVVKFFGEMNYGCIGCDAKCQ